MDLIIGLIAIVLVAYYIVKGYSATGVLMFGGLVLLFISVLMGHSILPDGVKSTGSTSVSYTHLTLPTKRIV